MNLYSLPLLICTTITIFFGFVVLSKNKKSKKNITFFFVCLSIAGWFFLYAVALNIEDKYHYPIVTILKIAYCFITFIPILCFHHTIELLNIKRYKTLISFFYLTFITFCFLILNTNLIIKNYYYNYFWGHYPVAGQLY